jgi:hypothetical protein
MAASAQPGGHDDRHLQLDMERPRRGLWASVTMGLGLVGLGVGATAITAALLPGPGAVVALVFEWTAIAGIGYSFAQSMRGPALAEPPSPADPLPAATPPAAALPADRAAPLLPPQRDPADRLPLTVRVKVEQIRRKAEMLLESQERFPIGSQQLFVLRRIQSDYLPATIDAHHALAGDDRPVTPDGRTALRVLRDQLDVLDSKLDEIADDLQRENADRLLANERFLEEHFGRPQLSDSDLRLD